MNQQMLDWDKLVSDERVFKPGRTKVGDDRSPFEADYDRVVYSAPFRRLAKKTQVHPLAPNDHVHNRMTHSIEVASVGRSFGKLLVKFLRTKGVECRYMEEIPTIMQVACLCHDIGNPPFGHAGEYVIREWCSNNSDFFGNLGDPVKGVTETLRKDVMNFEGNAQGFRIACRSDNPKCGYMRLTFGSLGAMVKYPWSSGSDMASKKKGKFNYFESEREIFDGAFSLMGLKRNDNSYSRHPLSFLTEAADDICYRILDMEDAVIMKILNEKPVLDLFRKIVAKKDDDNVPITQLRGMAVSTLINQIWKIFTDEYDVIMMGGRDSDLKTNLPPETQEVLREVESMYTDIFAHRNKVAYELGAYHVLGDILKVLHKSVIALKDRGSFEKTGFIDRRCLELVWGEQYVAGNEGQTYEWWIRQIIDYVSGLTDNYAIQVAGEIAGIQK